LLQIIAIRPGPGRRDNNPHRYLPAFKEFSMANRTPTPAVPKAKSSLGTRAHLTQGTLRSCTIGALPILNHFFQRMKLQAILQEHLPHEDRRTRIPLARALLVLVHNLLIAREPLYGLGEWAARHEPRQLGLSDEQVLALNDDRVGRCLAAFFSCNRPAFILDLVRHVIREFKLNLDELHNDSTTVSFFGAYREAAEEKTRQGQATPAITWGHSKDHRPDLKQLLYILTITADGGVPIHYRAASGNVTDDTTHCANWDLLCQIVGRSDFLYVADCKLATMENMNYIAGKHGRFVSVLPRTRKEDAAFRARLLQGEIHWQPLWDKCDDRGEVIDRFSVAADPLATPEGYRLWWFYTTRKAEFDLAARGARLQRAEQKLRQLQEKLRSPRARRRERGKLEEAVRKILEYYDVTEFIKVTINDQQQETYRQRRRGRPGKNTEYVKKVISRLNLDYTIDAEHLARARKSDGIFPLVTNDLQLSALAVLHAYKGQPQIEKRFEQLKTDFEVAPVFLKDVGRIEALLGVYFLVLLVEALLERELRQAMRQQKIESLPLYPEGRPCRRPTARRVIDLFEPIQRHTLEQAGGEPTAHITELLPLQRRIMRLLGLPGTTYEC
jgi:transposase